MPVIFALDCSLSMFIPFTLKNADESVIGVCKLGILSTADFLASTYQRAVSQAFAVFSSQCQIAMPFNRDISQLKPALDAVTCGDSVDVVNLVNAINRNVLETWITSQMITVVIITDGGISLKTNTAADVVPFIFPVKLHVVTVNPVANGGNFADATQWEKLVSHHNGVLHSLKASSASEMVAEFSRFAIENLQLPPVKLQLGCLSTYASAYPPASIFWSSNELHSITLDIGGFLPANPEIYNAEVASRHVLLYREKDGASTAKDDSQVSSLLTALFSILKQENVVALCRIRELDNQYAIIHISSEQKKRPCLNVAVLKPGPVPIPWLGPVSSLTLAALAPPTPSITPQKKKSYSDASSHITWSKAESLKSDVHRLLRLAKKLPDKSSLFFKELNKMRTSSLTLGTVDLLNVVSSALTREASSCSSPDGKAMLTSCAEQLVSGPSSQEIDVDIVYSAKN